MTKESNGTAAIILAAGKGTRMKSDLPKVMHQIACQPMLGHVMKAAADAGCAPLVIVTAPDMDDVADYAKTVDDACLIAIQNEQLGTGHAVLNAKDELCEHDGNVIVLFGDSPLITADTINHMEMALSKDPRCAVVVLGFTCDVPPAYGRLVMNEKREVLRIVEARDASPEELAITWYNAGVMAIRGSLVWSLLESIGCENAQGEYYLTDIIEIARSMGYGCKMVQGTPEEALGVNSRTQLAHVEHILQTRLRNAAMESGVTMIAPETVFMAADTEFGYDVTIQPHVFFGPAVVVGDGAEIRAFSHIEGTVIGDYAMVGPYARIRPGTNIGTECKIGNFVELKKATIEHGAKISHLSYIGDANVGEEANIGAGTITCNYDGYKKYHTEIGRDVFIGSNSALVAPVVIGAGAYVGAGSVVTEDVPADSLAVARARQSGKEDWAKDFRARMEEDEE